MIPEHKNLNYLLEDYQGNKITLAARLDVAWKIYNECLDLLKNKHCEKREVLEIAQEDTSHFMKTVLNTSTMAEAAELMNDRNRKQNLNSEYIPNRSPLRTQLKKSDPYSAPTKTGYQFRKLATLALRHAQHRVLSVNSESKKGDNIRGTLLLNAVERSDHQVLISKGRFLRRNEDNSFEPFDTSTYISHDKKKLCSYTINHDGEISVFNHLGGVNKLAHSSMNAQSTVLSAGELKILDGALITITAHSGHYLPDENNVFEALAYFKEQGVDISSAAVQLFDPIDGLDPIIHYNKGEIGLPYIYKAEEFFHYASIIFSQDAARERTPINSEHFENTDEGEDKEDRQKALEDLRSMLKSELANPTKNSTSSGKDSFAISRPANRDSFDANQDSFNSVSQPFDHIKHKKS